MFNITEEIQIILHGIWRRRWIALAVAWAVALLGWLVVALIPDVYQSHARVFVQIQSVLPDKVGITPLDQQKTIDQLRQTMTSQANLERVVRTTDLGLAATSDSEVMAKVAMLRTNVKVLSQGDNLFELTASSSDSAMSGPQNAKTAAQIVQALVQALQESNLQGGLADTNQSLKFLDQQIAARGKELAAAEQRRVAFEQKYVGVLPGAVGSIATRMDSLRSELAQIESQLVAAQSGLAGVNGQLASTPATVAASTGPGGQSPLAQAQSELAAAYARGWTDSHPDVQALKRQVEALRAGAGTANGAASVANPLYLQLRSLQSERSAAVAALQSRRGQVQADLHALSAKQVQEPGLAAEQDRLNRDYDVVKQQYDKLLADREDVRLRGEAQSEGGEVRFRLIDPPTMSSKPAFPNRPLLVMGVLFASVMAGIGAAFALGQLKATYATAARLERGTGLPVIGAITEIETPAVLAEKGRKMRWFYAASGGLVCLCVGLLAMEFIQRSMAA